MNYPKVPRWRLHTKCTFSKSTTFGRGLGRRSSDVRDDARTSQPRRRQLGLPPACHRP
ncbi:hypothetical protein HMPREF1861_02344 [Corynebacterium kroppenstedtii]|nr:hypothetical protein HMPREF1861_02344 [Corynebacterium kroppenstedtii]